MEACIDSLLGVREFCEIIIINDGSSDNTNEIAHRYADAYENVFAIDQPNSNWGGVVNHGLELARGYYFKIVDSDDSLDIASVRKVLAVIADTIATPDEPDLIITNYLYDHRTSNSSHVIGYRNLLPENRTFTWKEIGTPGIDQIIMVHATWFKTQVLRDSGVKLPTGVSYMDSLFVLHPLPYVEKLYYLDQTAYRYLIGREGQSVEVDVVLKNIDQQLLASMLAIDDADYTQLFASEPNRAKMMANYIVAMMSVSTIYLFKIGTPDAIARNKQLWSYMKRKNPVLYKRILLSWAGLANRRTTLGRYLACKVYDLTQRIFKFA